MSTLPLSPLIVLLACICAFLPVMAWHFVLKRKQREGMSRRAIFVFLMSAGGAIGFSTLFHMGNIPDSPYFSSLIFLILFGILIEYFKNLTVRIGGKSYFKNIDDVIDLSFTATLGFTFAENIVEFSLAFSGGLGFSSDPIALVKFFLVREFFVLPIHLFCSGLFGYFYGMALFAGNELQERNKKDFSFRIFSVFFSFLPKNRRFKAVKIAQGTFLSVFFYSVFFTLLHTNPTIADVFAFFGLPESPLGIDEEVILLIAFALFKVGTVLFFGLMDKKRRWERQKLFLLSP